MSKKRIARELLRIADRLTTESKRDLKRLVDAIVKNMGRYINEYTDKEIDFKTVGELELKSYTYEPAQYGGMTDPSWDAYIDDLTYEDKIRIKLDVETFLIDIVNEDLYSEDYSESFVLRALKIAVRKVPKLKNVTVIVDYEHAGECESTADVDKMRIVGSDLVLSLSNIWVVDEQSLYEDVEKHLDNI